MMQQGNKDGIPLHVKAKTFCIAVVTNTRIVSSYETCHHCREIFSGTEKTGRQQAAHSVSGSQLLDALLAAAVARHYLTVEISESFLTDYNAKEKYIKCVEPFPKEG